MIFRKKTRLEPITVVSGLPRSGTSMMMKILEAGGLTPLTDGMRTADDDNPRGYYEFERAKKLQDGDVAWLPDARGKVVKVIAMLLTYLPSDYTYRVVFMRREMREILASQRKMLINRGVAPDKISDQEMGALFEKHLHRVDQWIAGQPHIKRIDVDYNQLMTAPAPIIEEVYHFLGHLRHLQQMIAVVDPELYRQRRDEPR